MGDDPNAGSTDMGNVSWVCPTIHPDLAIAPRARLATRSLFRDAAATPRADETTLLAATLVAQTAYELFADPGARRGAAWAEFRRRSAEPHAAGRSRRTGATIARRAPLDDRIRTGGAPSETDTPDAAACRPRPSPEDPVAERPRRPGRSTATSRP